MRKHCKPDWICVLPRGMQAGLLAARKLHTEPHIDCDGTYAWPLMRPDDTLIGPISVFAADIPTLSFPPFLCCFQNTLSRSPANVFSFLTQLQYPSLPWVRYITQSGDIAVRLPDVQ